MDAQTRLGWVELYQEIGNAGVVCRRCGISRPTLRKWWRRYQALGMAGLEEQSRRPHSSLGFTRFCGHCYAAEAADWNAAAFCSGVR